MVFRFYLFLLFSFTALPFAFTQESNDTTSAQPNQQEHLACKESFTEYNKAKETRREVCEQDSNITECEEKLRECQDKLETEFPVNTNGAIDEEKVEAFQNECPKLLGALNNKLNRRLQRAEALLEERRQEQNEKKQQLTTLLNNREQKQQEIENKINELINGKGAEGDKKKSLDEMSLSELESKKQDALSNQDEMNAAVARYQAELSKVNQKIEQAKTGMSSAKIAYRRAINQVALQCDDLVEKSSERILRQCRTVRSIERDGGSCVAAARRRHYIRCKKSKRSYFAVQDASLDYREALGKYTTELDNLIQLQQRLDEQFQTQLQLIERSKKEEVEAIHNEIMRRQVELTKKQSEISKLMSEKNNEEENNLTAELEEMSESFDEAEHALNNLKLTVPNQTETDELASAVDGVLTGLNYDHKKQVARDDCCNPPPDGSHQFSVKPNIGRRVSGSGTFCRSITTEGSPIGEAETQGDNADETQGTN